MNPEWLLIAPIEPVAWQRVRRDRHGTTYVPKETARFKHDLAMIAKSKFLRAPYAGPLKVQLMFWLPKPKRPKAHEPCVRPDLDNYVKGVFDALNGIVWDDDGQIVQLIAEKRYATEKPQIWITVQALGTN